MRFKLGMIMQCYQHAQSAKRESKTKLFRRYFNPKLCLGVLMLCFSSVFAGGFDINKLPSTRVLTNKQPAQTINQTPLKIVKTSKIKSKKIKAVLRHGLIVIMLYPGSLKDNLQRAAKNYGWPDMVWTINHDYRWYGVARVTAKNLAQALSKILYQYPLQAVFYRGNHVLAIQARNIYRTQPKMSQPPVDLGVGYAG